MEALNWIRFLVAAICITGGMVFYVIQFIGLFRFKYVLNRLHAGALGDTLGSGLILIGVIILYGFSFATLKLICIVIALWCTTPVASHMVAKFEVLSKRNIEDYCNLKDISSGKEDME